MDTKDRKEKQLTLIEFNEEQQAFNFNEDGQTPPREGWMPIMWLDHDAAVRWTKTVKEKVRDNRILPPKRGKMTLEEVLYVAHRAVFEAGFDEGYEVGSNLRQEVYLVLDVCDEGGADVKAAFDDELTAYHYMDCEGGDCVEHVLLRRKYKNHQRRTYRISLAKGKSYGDVKDEIRAVDSIKGFEREDVKQAVRWDKDKDGELLLDAYLIGSHRYQIFKNAESIIAAFDAERDELGQWYEHPTGVPLTPRSISPFERSIHEALYAGDVSVKPLRGLMDRFLEEYEQFKNERDKKKQQD